MKKTTPVYANQFKQLFCTLSILLLASCSSTTKSPPASDVRVTSPSNTNQVKKAGKTEALQNESK